MAKIKISHEKGTVYDCPVCSAEVELGQNYCQDCGEPLEWYKDYEEDKENKCNDDLISRDEVIKVVDRHTREDGTLDDDISVILEEVKTAFNKEKVTERLNQLLKMYCSYYDQLDDSEIRPKNKQLCVVIPKWLDWMPMIAQWRSGSGNPHGIDCFYIVGTMFPISCFKPSDIKYQAMSHIRFWKPLELPDDVNEYVLTEIEKYFEENK